MKREYHKHGDVLVFKFHVPGFSQAQINALVGEVLCQGEANDDHPEAIPLLHVALPRALDDEQLAVLAAYAKDHGRHWKRDLNDAWSTGDYGYGEDTGTLQTIRNTFGPSWLVRFSFTKTATHRELP